jgi:hypothetical protein
MMLCLLDTDSIIKQPTKRKRQKRKVCGEGISPVNENQFSVY